MKDAEKRKWRDGETESRTDGYILSDQGCGEKTDRNTDRQIQIEWRRMWRENRWKHGQKKCDQTESMMKERKK